jgi:HSP20 family protein
MADTTSKLPIKTTTEKQAALAPKAREWHPFESLRREVDRLFEDFDRGSWRAPFTRSVFDIEPFWRREWPALSMPAVDIVEHEKDYQISAEVPGMDAGDLEIKLSNGTLTIRGEKKEEKEEKKKNSYLSERHYGSFERSFRVPEGVDADKIEASFKNGVLTVSLPKTAEAQNQEKKITVKAA